MEIKLTLYEKLALRWIHIQKELEKIHKIGQTRLSFLFIPHNNDRIFRIEASYYLIAFLSAMGISILILCLYFSAAFLIFREKSKLISEAGHKQKKTFQHYAKIAKEMENSMEDLEENLENLNKVTWGKFSRDARPSLTEELEDETVAAGVFYTEPEMKTNMKIYTSTVEKFKNLHIQLQKLKPLFLNASDYLETRESIVQSMPRGRPLGPGVGFIASTYGGREDPVKGGGEHHNGVDFAAPNGTPIYATAPAIVAEASHSESSFGNFVKLHHPNGYFTLYAHCSELKVKKGEKVSRGDLIALVGSTGKSTGTHLHYEVHIGMDPPYNPQEFINLD